MQKYVKENALKRLKSAQGHLDHVIKQVEEEKYCIDIITQTSAVKKALSGVEDLILENHLSTHVVEQMKKGEKNKAVKEILSIYKLSKRKKFKLL